MSGFSFVLFQRFVLRDINRNWMRTVLTVLGIALGVSVFLAISIANGTALSRFRETVSQVAGKANLELIANSGPSLPESTLASLDFLPLTDVKATAIIDEHVIVENLGSRESRPEAAVSPTAKENSKQEIVQVVGIDMLADPQFKKYESEGESSAGNGSIFDPLSVYVGGSLAERLGVKPGSTIKCIADDRIVNLSVVNVLGKSGLGGAYSGNLLVADLDCAQNLLGMQGRVSRIDMIVPPELLPALTEKLQSSFPDIMVSSPETRSKQAEKMTRSFEYNLLALTFIALMVGMFLIYNTMTITVLRRRPEIGILRALGVPRRLILNMFFLEALALGVSGTALGVITGSVMAQGALRAVAQTFQYFYFKVPLERVDIEPSQYLLAASIGIGLTLLAAVPPLLEATAVSPAEATRRASFETRARSSKKLLFALGLVCMALCYVASLQAPVYDFPLFGYVAAFLSIVGASLLMPLTLAAVLPPLSRLLASLFGVEGKVAASSLNGTLSRTAVASASLMIGIAMMVSLAIMISSFRKTVTLWIDQSFQADLWLQSQARSSGNKSGRLSQEVLKSVCSISGVAAAEGFVDRPIIYDGMKAFLGAADFDVLAKYGNQLFLSGESNEAVCNRLVGNRAIISEPFAVRKKLKKGDSVEIPTPSGKSKFYVEDVYYDYASDLGYVLIPRSTYRTLYGDDTVSSVAIYLKQGENLDAIRNQILRVLDSKVTVSSTQELRREAIRIFDRTFAITYALHTIAVTVAILSVMNALFALTLESKREFAILRYLGARTASLSKIVYIQAGILGVAGNTSGIALGYILSLLLIHVINKQSFGWSVQYSMPLDFIVESTILTVVTAVVSGVIPARIAAKTLAPSVIRDE